MRSQAEEAKMKVLMDHRTVGAISGTMGGGGRITSVRFVSKLVRSHVPCGSWHPTVIMDSISL